MKNKIIATLKLFFMVIFFLFILWLSIVEASKEKENKPKKFIPTITDEELKSIELYSPEESI